MRIVILTKSEYTGFIISNLAGDFEFILRDEKCDFSEPFCKKGYDVGISFMYQYKVPKSELDKATWFNFHPAPLPGYKGRNLCYHAIMNGEKEFGAALHYMDENFDTGDIIEVRNFVINDCDTAEDVSFGAVLTAKALFREYFPMILKGYDFNRFPNVGGTYYQKQPISDEIWIPERTATHIRAITYGDFYPKVNIGGATYKIVRDE